MVSILKHKVIKVDEKTHIQLLYLSKITGMPMNHILREIMQNITSLSIMYSKGCTFRCEHRITASQVYITLRGHSPTFAFGTAKTDSEMHEKAKAQLKAGKVTKN
jgi:hypothetical protein